MTIVEDALFDDVADVMRGMTPAELGDLRCRAHRYGIKVWFGPEKPTREHYEAQVIGAKEVKRAKVLALEVGFHSEYAKPAENDAVINHLLASEKKWRRSERKPKSDRSSDAPTTGVAFRKLGPTPT